VTQRAYNLLRLKTALRQFQEMHERTGSVWQATRFFVRFVAAKTPLLLRQAVQTTRRGSVLSDIDAARAAVGQDTPFLGLRVSGGLGDYLTIARFVRDLSRSGGGFTFDIYCTDPVRAKWVFSGVPGLRSCYDDILFDAAMAKYDLAAWIGQFVIFFEDVAQWDRLRARPDLAQAAKNAIRYRPKIELFIKNHPQLDGFLAQKAIYSNASRANYLHHIAGIPYGGDRFDIDLDHDAPLRHALRPGSYITVHNGFDPGFVVTAQRATKCYPHFGEVITLLKQHHPGLPIVQIGAGTSDRIDEADFHLLGKTSLREAAGLVKNARLHIDNEGGLVHLASCVGVTSCVVFGPTPSAYFGYTSNINIDPSFCGGCWWINQSWMNQCPRDFPTARCMTEQDPANVANAILRHPAMTAIKPATQMAV
jgi:hypothetical protein